MTQNKSAGGNDAFSLFPDLMKNVVRANQPKAAAPTVSPLPEKRAEAPPAALRSTVLPPPHPDISWLSEGNYVEKAQATTEPTALLLMTGDGKAEILQALQGVGYKIEQAGSQSEAIEKVKAIDFAAIVVDAGFTGAPFAESPFHTFMKWLPMQRRRPIHYTFIGPQAHTLYSLEALCESVNLVVNDRDTKHFDIILRKGLLEHNTLFQPYMALLAQRKKASAQHAG